MNAMHYNDYTRNRFKHLLSNCIKYNNSLSNHNCVLLFINYVHYRLAHIIKPIVLLDLHTVISEQNYTYNTSNKTVCKFNTCDIMRCMYKYECLLRQCVCEQTINDNCYIMYK